MLGQIKSKQTWVWGAAGKHPVAKDFIHIGAQAPLLKAFSDWVESGYKALNSNHTENCSWRFWARGLKRQELVCGLVRDSFDSVGRPFPFLVIGTGQVDGWEDHWELIPHVLDSLWVRMEYLSTKKAHDINALENDLCLIPGPSSNELYEKKPAYQIGPEDLPGIEDLGKSAEYYLPIRGEDSVDPAETFSKIHSQVKSRIDFIPNTVFIGGTLDKNYLVIFNRSLTSKDFTRLWSVSGK